ncbi:hypothetical protein CRENBAI_003282 [Crenichthys baileyi]|uniref:Uncharacterized protein n=1 Tax=Crenichthys baileyi TaxID=28760 RepID=A0AAV9S245_9TELE
MHVIGMRQKRRIPSGERMSEMMKVEADEPRAFRLVPLIPAAETSELEQKQYSKDLNKQQLLAVKEEVLDLWSSNLDQQNPELLQIKKEEEELEGEQLTVKIEHEEKPQLSELH